MIDQEQQRLTKLWYETRDDPKRRSEHFMVHSELCTYLWQRAKSTVEADRKAHPKAKRNQPVPPRVPEDPSSRVLP